jgi:hypothetical protein
LKAAAKHRRQCSERLPSTVPAEQSDRFASYYRTGDGRYKFVGLGRSVFCDWVFCDWYGVR